MSAATGKLLLKSHGTPEKRYSNFNRRKKEKNRIARKFPVASEIRGEGEREREREEEGKRRKEKSKGVREE